MNSMKFERGAWVWRRSIQSSHLTGTIADQPITIVNDDGEGPIYFVNGHVNLYSTDRTNIVINN